MVGNGAALSIQHSGKGLLPTPTHTFHLNLVLYVPDLLTNLVSVQQLTKENAYTVTFDIKATKRILSKGNNHGLY